MRNLKDLFIIGCCIAIVIVVLPDAIEWQNNNRQKEKELEKELERFLDIQMKSKEEKYPESSAVAVKISVKKPKPKLTNKSSSEEKFIEDIAEIAIEESERVNSKIPPSLIIAQAILESNWGRSRLAIKANNYFGHKQKGEGPFILADDDQPNEKFVKFKSRWYSIRAHSKLLMGNLYYGRLKGEPTLENWLTALCGSSNSVESKKFIKRGGMVYATACYNNCYACKIRDLVDQYDLKRFDDKGIIAYR